MRKRFIARMEEEILEHTNLTRAILNRAACFYQDVSQTYHTYFHAVTFTYALLQMGKVNQFCRGKVSMLALAGLYHDSGNEDVPWMTPLDELRAALNFYNDWHGRREELCVIAEAEPSFDHLQLVKRGMGLILATPMHVRREIACDSDHALFTDADFHFCAATPCYWMYTSQGMRLEWSATKNDVSLLDPIKFWRFSNVDFIERFLMPCGHYGPFRSRAARSVFTSDPRWIQGVIEHLPDAAYQRAMDLHDEDIELNEFCDELMRIPGMPQEFALTQHEFLRTIKRSSESHGGRGSKARFEC